MVIVSHDREFLDQLCTKVVETERGVAHTFKGECQVSGAGTPGPESSCGRVGAGGFSLQAACCLCCYLCCFAPEWRASG
jgi:hypothetical protein